MLDFLHDALFTVQMILSVILATSSELQTLAAMALVALVASGIAWWLQQQKIRLLKIRHGEETAGWQAQLTSQKEESLKQAALAQKHLDEALAERAVVEERFALHREAAQRRENDSLARIGMLENDLAATREIAAKLPHVQARIGDLETAISSERGRVGALEQTLQVTNTRAQELSAQLQEALARSAAFEEKTQAREAELVRQLADREQSLASDQARLGTVDDEIARLKDAQTAYQTTAESRIATLQRQLAAAEAKSAMVQKEFMSAVGVLPESAPSTGGLSDKRIIDLEAKISQAEAEARKKAREDGYKIAELEYRLSEANDAVVKLKEAEDKAAEVESLRAEVKTLMADQEALLNDIETLKLLKAKSVEPVPEVLEQSLLPMDSNHKSE